MVIRGDVGKCGRRCTLDAGANAIRRRVLYIRITDTGGASGVVLRWGGRGLLHSWTLGLLDSWTLGRWMILLHRPPTSPLSLLLVCCSTFV